MANSMLWENHLVPFSHLIQSLKMECQALLLNQEEQDETKDTLAQPIIFIQEQGGVEIYKDMASD